MKPIRKILTEIEPYVLPPLVVLVLMSSFIVVGCSKESKQDSPQTEDQSEHPCFVKVKIVESGLHDIERDIWWNLCETEQGVRFEVLYYVGKQGDEFMMPVHQIENKIGCKLFSSKQNEKELEINLPKENKIELCGDGCL